MAITVSSKEEAWEIIKKFNPRADFEQDSENKNLYYAHGITKIMYVEDLNARFDVGMLDGSSFNIWINYCDSRTTFTVGFIKEVVPFADVVINEVIEEELPDCKGFVFEPLDNGKQGVTFYRQDEEKASFHINSIAYVKMK